MEGSDNPSTIRDLIISGKIGFYIETVPGMMTVKVRFPQEAWLPDSIDWLDACNDFKSYWPFNQISRDFYSCTDRLWVNRHELKATLAREKEGGNQNGQSNEISASDESDCNPRSKNSLFTLILGLAHLFHINLAEPGLAASLENATGNMGRRLPRSTADRLLEEIAKFEKNLAN